MTRIKKGTQSGELWDKVLLSNGMVGYVFQTYVKEYKEIINISVQEIYIDTDKITLEVGKNFKINPIIYPENVTNRSVNYLSENEQIAMIDENGNITGVKKGSTTIVISSDDGNKSKNIAVEVIDEILDSEIKFEGNLKINGNEISGINYEGNSVKEIKKSIITNYKMEIYNKNNELLEETDLVGTGCKLQVKDEYNKIIVEYNFLLYGDVNGDGKIDSIDLLVLQRHILEISMFNGIYFKAGNISKNGKNPSSVDLLLIQRHILELKTIEQ